MTVQVKTMKQAHCLYKRKPENNGWNWRLSGKAKELCGESVFYAFVDLKRLHRGTQSGPMLMPDVFIVPADFVKDQPEHLLQGREAIRFLV